jgi:hypothetical protein
VLYSCSNTVGWESVSSAIASAVALLDIQTNKQAHQQQRARTLSYQYWSGRYIGLYRWGINQYWAVLWILKNRCVLSLKFPWMKEPPVPVISKTLKNQQVSWKNQQWIVGPVDTILRLFTYFSKPWLLTSYLHER